MHHALLISEISTEICGALDYSSLPAVARTCRALCEPALDELWRDLFSIYPFIHLLAPTILDENDQLSVQHLTSQQWSSLRDYSTRTRSLSVCMVDDVPHFDRFPCLFSPPDPHAFFPNLRTLAWYPDNHLAMLPFFRLLCGPALTSLSAEFATDPTSLATVAALGVLCPNITDISISASTESLSDDLASALSTSICRWKDLKSVSCDDLTVSALEHLRRSRHLASFAACASSQLASFSRTLDAHQLSFPRLEHLHLYTGLLSTTTACMTRFRLSLEEFRVDVFDAGEVFSDPSCLRDFFTALSRSTSHVRLARLYLCAVHPHPAPTAARATIHALRPLFHFARLRVVSFDGLDNTFALDDAAIAEMAEAWPEVERLALTTCVDPVDAAPLPTLASLAQLLRALPKLAALSLVVDATSPLPLPSPSYSSMSSSSSRGASALRDLRLGNSPLDDPVAVARALGALCPALDRVDMSVWNEAPLSRLARRERYEMGWGTVNLELGRLRAG